MKTLKAAPEMNDQEHIFSNLPPEIILSILSRIPIKTIFTCKCVCKSWLGVLEYPEFARSHLSNSVSGLLTHHAIYSTGTDTDIFKIFGFEDSLEIESHELHYKRVLELKSENTFDNSTPSITQIDGSTNGLVFIRNAFPDPQDYYICNPITHESLKLPKPEGIPGIGTIVTHGFGVSRLSNQYKVVMIFHDFVRNPGTVPKIVCQVYTLGTGSWRSITAPRELLLDYGCRSPGKLLNGNLHWLARDLMGTMWISCFDLETGVFTKFRAPIVDLGGPLALVGVLRDRLSLSDLSSMSEIVICLMTEGGYEKKSWNKEYVISKIPAFSGESIDVVCAVKAFGDGDLLLSLYHVCLLCYSTRTKTMARVNMLNVDFDGYLDAILFTPSFISLNDFETENAKLFEYVCSMS